MTAPRPSPRGALVRLVPAVLVALLCLPLLVGTTSSGFVATTANADNRLATAATFAWSPVPESADSSGTSPVNSSTTASAWTPRLAGVAGAPWVVWVESEGSHGGARRVHVRRWDGTVWQPVGGPFGSDARTPSITAVDGTPFVAWTELGTPTTVRVARWTGSTWQAVQVNSSDAWNLDHQKDASRPRVAAVGRMLWVVWHEYDSSDRYLQVKWRSFDTSTSTPGGDGVMAYDAARQAVDPDVVTVDSEPWVVYSETNEAGVAIVRVRTPSRGVGQHEGLNVDPGRSAYGAAIAVGADSRPHIAFREETDGCWQVRTRRWTGDTWVRTGGTSLATEHCDTPNVGGGTGKYPDGVPVVGDPSIAVVGGTAWVSWAERSATGDLDVMVARYVAATDRWVRFGALDVDPQADGTSPHLVGVGGRPYGVFTEWDGGAWEVRVAGQ